ncbi:hypothetical protein GQX74_003256 [Glossina fuscipes]|nr:hypothetical protein GQX74_003256 [Glossina fuscipes]
MSGGQKHAIRLQLLAGWLALYFALCFNWLQFNGSVVLTLRILLLFSLVQFSAGIDGTVRASANNNLVAKMTIDSTPFNYNDTLYNDAVEGTGPIVFKVLITNTEKCKPEQKKKINK